MNNVAERITMQRVRVGEVPYDGGTAVQQDPGRPVFRGNGRYDYVCAQCGNLLATAMEPEHMTFRVRVRCGICATINVAVNDDRTPEERQQRRRP